MARFFISCPDAVRLISHAQDQALPQLERIGLRLHLVTCRDCSRYAQQMIVIRSVFRDYADRVAGEKLSRDRIERIVRQLR